MTHVNFDGNRICIKSHLCTYDTASITRYSKAVIESNKFSKLQTTRGKSDRITDVTRYDWHVQKIVVFFRDHRLASLWPPSLLISNAYFRAFIAGRSPRGTCRIKNNKRCAILCSDIMEASTYSFVCIQFEYRTDSLIKYWPVFGGHSISLSALQTNMEEN